QPDKAKTAWKPVDPTDPLETQQIRYCYYCDTCLGSMREFDQGFHDRCHMHATAPKKKSGTARRRGGAAKRRSPPPSRPAITPVDHASLSESQHRSGGVRTARTGQSSHEETSSGRV